VVVVSRSTGLAFEVGGGSRHSIWKLYVYWPKRCLCPITQFCFLLYIHINESKYEYLVQADGDHFLHPAI